MSLQTVYDGSDLKKSTKAPKEFLRMWTERQHEEAKKYLSAQSEGTVHLVNSKTQIYKKDPKTLKMSIQKVDQSILYYDR